MLISDINVHNFFSIPTSTQTVHWFFLCRLRAYLLIYIYIKKGKQVFLFNATVHAELNLHTSHLMPYALVSIDRILSFWTVTTIVALVFWCIGSVNACVSPEIGRRRKCLVTKMTSPSLDPGIFKKKSENQINRYERISSTW